MSTFHSVMTNAYPGKLPLTFDNFNAMRAKLNDQGYVKIPHLLQVRDYEMLQRDVRCLEGRMARRDFTMPGYETPRHLHVAGGRLISSLCPFIISTYSNAKILSVITQIVGKPLYQIDHPDEFVVVNFLTQQKDTHGWHLDDPRYALIIAITVPEEGAHIEVIPRWKQFLKTLQSEIISFSDQVEHARKTGLVIEDKLESGDAYLLDAGETLHQVTPVIRGTRVAINFAYHDMPSLKYGETANLLYAQPV